MDRELREFNAERLIAELKDFAHDYKRGDFSKYRLTQITRSKPSASDAEKAGAKLRRKR